MNAIRFGLLAGFVCVRLSGSVLAADTEAVAAGRRDFAAALVPTVQTPPAEWDVTLARFSLVCGRNRNVYGLDFGILGNLVDDNMVGLEFSGLFNVVGRSASSFQFAGVSNWASGDFTGMQAALGLSYSKGDFIGLQAGAITITEKLRGMQFGVLNKARAGAGFQLGVLNEAEQFTGVQLGVINLNLESSVPMAPILNCYF